MSSFSAVVKLPYLTTLPLLNFFEQPFSETGCACWGVQTQTCRHSNSTFPPLNISPRPRSGDPPPRPDVTPTKGRYSSPLLPGRGRAANRRSYGTRPRFQHWVPLRDWCSVVAAPDLLAVVPDVGLDLPGYVLKKADCRLGEVYGDHIHDNDGTHLDGGGRARQGVAGTLAASDCSDGCF